MLVIFLCLIVIMFVQLYPLINEVIANTADESKTVEYIQNHGAQGVPILITLAALQNIIIIIPSVAVGVLTGLSYGTFWGPLIYLTGFALGNIIVFISIRQLRGLITPHFKHKSKHKELFSKTQLEKMKRPWIVVFFCFLIPGMPSTALTYLFASTKIPIHKYIFAATAGTAPSAFLYVFFGDHLSEGNYTEAIIFAGVFVIVLLFFLIFKKRILNIIIRRSTM